MFPSSITMGHFILLFKLYNPIFFSGLQATKYIITGNSKVLG